MPIPGLDGRHGYLPPGVHAATLEDVQRRFATNRRRKVIFEGLEHVVTGLRSRGVTEIWVDGSFVTSRLRPGDVDIAFTVPPGYGPQWGELHIHSRDSLKASRRVDLLPSTMVGNDNATGALLPILDYIQSDRDGIPKGIIRLLQSAGWSK